MKSDTGYSFYSELKLAHRNVSLAQALRSCLKSERSSSSSSHKKKMSFAQAHVRSSSFPSFILINKMQLATGFFGLKFEFNEAYSIELIGVESKGSATQIYFKIKGINKEK